MKKKAKELKSGEKIKIGGKVFLVIGIELSEIGKVAKLQVLGERFLEKSPDKLIKNIVEQDIQDLKANKLAERIAEKLRFGSQEDKNQALKTINDFPKLPSKVLNKLKEANQDHLSYEERNLKSLRGKKKIDYIKSKRKEMTREQYNAWIDDLIQKGILTQGLF